MTMHIVPFRPEHLNGLVNVSEPELQGVKVEASLADSIGWTGMENDEVLGIIGVKILWAGVGDAWAVFTPQAQKYMLSISRKAKRGINTFMEEQKLVRLQTVVRVGNAVALRWAQWLGFHTEGYMEWYYGGMDYLIMAKLKRR